MSFISRNVVGHIVVLPSDRALFVVSFRNYSYREKLIGQHIMFSPLLTILAPTLPVQYI